ncbi:hypothetical protein INR49_017004 [Caranx melampygus]|nr:hypothetical protein INR49_017004 [Caranx melampygus]
MEEALQQEKQELEYKNPDEDQGGIRRRLRDRDLLRKRKAEAEEKETNQWVLGVESQRKRSRTNEKSGTKKRGRPRKTDPTLEISVIQEETAVAQEAPAVVVVPEPAGIISGQTSSALTPLLAVGGDTLESQPAAIPAAPISVPLFGPAQSFIPAPVLTSPDPVNQTPALVSPSALAPAPAVVIDTAPIPIQDSAPSPDAVRVPAPSQAPVPAEAPAPAVETLYTESQDREALDQVLIEDLGPDEEEDISPFQDQRAEELEASRSKADFVCSFVTFSICDMSPLCDCCGENTNKLKQQVSVMRKEIKNLRQMLDSAVRANRKHMISIQSAVSKIGVCEAVKDQTQPPAPSQPASPQAALEQGNIQTVPIGYISSCFSVKNGTPRQPTICGPSRAELRIQQSVFNNPEHALVGLEQYSHVWIIFLFHKNGHLSYKAKVKPPRLNGERVGVYSTRSPHRPNALGLTLAKLDKIVGDTIHLSDIDMIAGTPVLDVKPYIPEYDSPQTRVHMESEMYEENANQPNITTIEDLYEDSETDAQSGLRGGKAYDNQVSQADTPLIDSSKVSAQFSLPRDLHGVLEEVKAYVTQGDFCQREDQVSECSISKPPESTVDCPCYGEESYSTIAGWIREPPVASLEVRFTPNAERELAEFLPAHLSGAAETVRPRFKFLRSPDEAAAAIRGVLSADPRSVYRRTRCRDRLFFFTLDTADITCWFGQGFAEVLQVRPVESKPVTL